MRTPRSSSSKSTRNVGPAEPEFIEVVGAREHNLHIDFLRIPKRKLVVFTGVSGSGKSSLAFDTLYAEGQRRYVETLSSYARQFLGQLERPHVEHLRGLSPTIAIEQKSAVEQPALHGRHDHRGLRLPARALRARRRAALPRVRQAREGAQPREEIVRRAARASAEGTKRPACSRRSSRTARASSGSCSRI